MYTITYAPLWKKWSVTHYNNKHKIIGEEWFDSKKEALEYKRICEYGYYE